MTRTQDIDRYLTKWAIANPDMAGEPGALMGYRDQLLTLDDATLTAMHIAPTQKGPAGSTQDPNKLIALAQAEKGKRYAGPIIGESDAARWGNPGWDCSSFVSGMYKKLGINLTPFTDQAAKETTKIDPAQAQPGDIIFYRYKDESQPGVQFPHMAIYTGPGRMIDASYGGGVQERAMLNKDYEIHRAPGYNPVPVTTAEARGSDLGYDGGFTMGPNSPFYRTMEYIQERDNPGNLPLGGAQPIPNWVTGTPVRTQLMGGDVQYPSTAQARGSDFGYTNAVPGIERFFNPAKDKPQSWEEAAGFVADAAKNAGLDEEGTKAALSVLRQEGGYTGAVNPKSGSVGALQFAPKGELANFARSINRTPAEASALLQQAPMAGVDWALRGYLGNAIREGQAKGLTGAELATYAQQYGQRSESPQLAGQRYTELFGGGQAVPSLYGTATGASGATRRAGLAPVSFEDLSSPDAIMSAIENTFVSAAEAAAALDPSDPIAYQQGHKAIQDAMKGQLDLLQWAQTRGDTLGYQQMQRELAYAKLGQDDQFHADDVRDRLAKMAMDDRQFNQKFGLDMRKYMEIELPQAAMAMRVAEAGLTEIDPATGLPTPAGQRAQEALNLQRAGLFGTDEAGNKTVGLQSLEETISQHRDALRQGFATMLGQQGEALQTARSNADVLAQRIAQNAPMLEPGGQYVLDQGPGGMVESLRGKLGLPFSPLGVDQLAKAPDPYAGLSELQAAFERARQAYPGQGGNTYGMG